MVKGLDVFKRWFAQYGDQYVLIGGTAASLTMEEGEIEFRATKDLDIVLHIEALTPAFNKTFWQFVETGGYRIQQSNDTGRPIFYRFQHPTDNDYPAMLELFSRAPDGLPAAAGSRLTPIPLDEAISSLSAILLDNDYYDFIMAGRRTIDGLTYIGVDRLIPLKAIAWLDLSARKEQGDKVDGKNVRKHLNDVLRLSQLLAPPTRIPLAPKISNDLTRFLAAAASDISIDPKTLKLGKTIAEIVARIAQVYELDPPGQVGN